MKITLLGTGTSQGVPVIACTCPVCQSGDSRDKRLRSSVLVQTEGISIVIDAGPDFRQQMLFTKTTMLDAILFTHEHKDHVAGLDDVRAFNFVLQRPMDIYAEERVHDTIKQEFAYIFAERKYPGIPEIRSHYIENNPFNVNGLQVIPVRAFHYKLPVFGYRIGDFGYLTDANHISPEERDKFRGLDTLVVTALRKKPHISHFNVEEALALIDDLKPKQAYLTHISHQMGLHALVDKELPDGVNLGYDGLEIIIG
ncbi:MAG: MBL fold metallo-hydrolase [Bacteroidota bacterium]